MTSCKPRIKQKLYPHVCWVWKSPWSSWEVQVCMAIVKCCSKGTVHAISHVPFTDKIWRGNQEKLMQLQPGVVQAYKAGLPKGRVGMLIKNKLKNQRSLIHRRKNTSTCNKFTFLYLKSLLTERKSIWKAPGVWIILCPVS